MKRVGLRWVSRGSCSHPELMTLKGGSLCAAEFPAMVGIIRHPDRGIFLFDTGYDDAFLQATDPFPERLYRWMTPPNLGDCGDTESWLARYGVAIDEIAGIILSHFHGDHVAGLRTFRRVPVYCSAAGFARIHSGNRLGRVRQGFLRSLLPSDLHQRASFFEDLSEVELPADYRPFETGRDLLGDGSLLAVDLPGHCAGHWGLALRTMDGRFTLLAADAAWSSRAIAEAIPPPRLTTALLGNTRAYRQTLDGLHAACRANPDLLILPSHCSVAASKVPEDAQ